MNDLWFSIELTLILAIIAIQCYLLISSFRRIDLYRFMFRMTVRPLQEDLLRLFSQSNDRLGRIPRQADKAQGIIINLTGRSGSTRIISIVDSINQYLQRNRGAYVDFHLLKDIVDRDVDTLEEDINNAIPAPLYLGLAATMLGIIIGLVSISDPSGSDVKNIIEPVITGVKIAMVASVIGLLFTTFNSQVVFRFAKINLEQDKNDFLSFLQSELLPIFIKGEAEGFARLQRSLDNFGKQLEPSIGMIAQAARATSDAVEKEQMIIEEIRKIGVKEVATKNYEVVSKLAGLMDSLGAFSDYVNLLNSSAKGTAELNENTRRLIEKLQDIDGLADTIKNTVDTNREHSQILRQLLQYFEQRKESLMALISEGEMNFTDALRSFEGHLTGQLNSINGFTSTAEPQLLGAFRTAVDNINALTEHQLEKLSEAYAHSGPQFGQLAHLPAIEENIRAMKEEMHRSNSDLLVAMKESQVVFSRAIDRLGQAMMHRINVTPGTQSSPDRRPESDPGQKRKWFHKAEQSLRITAYVSASGAGLYFAGQLILNMVRAF